MNFLCLMGWLFLIAATNFLSSSAYATTRADAIACVQQFHHIDPLVGEEEIIAGAYEEHVGVKQGDSAGAEDVLVGASEEEVKTEISKVKIRLNILYEIELVPCDASDNVSSLFSQPADGFPAEYTGKYYLMYNKRWVATIM
ncbi:hypothetical protein ACC713_20465 [Rhizobium johnstonii]|uniref:hypothetical protein n=1 Tax=Rhizobium johnstonii TaxID=3019933 RepID=UPI003F9C49E8